MKEGASTEIHKQEVMRSLVLCHSALEGHATTKKRCALETRMAKMSFSPGNLPTINNYEIIAGHSQELSPKCLFRVSYSFDQKHFLGQFSLLFLEHPIIKL